MICHYMTFHSTLLSSLIDGCLTSPALITAVPQGQSLVFDELRNWWTRNPQKYTTPLGEITQICIIKSKPT
jgi:hypothetical protein